MNKKNILILIGITFSAVFGLFLLSNVGKEENLSNANELATFATCISDSGAKFYGAFWCSHCQNQKLAFGVSASLLPYIECSTEDNKQVPECRDAKIEGYPTWEFLDGSRLSGELSFPILSEKTGCTLPAVTN